MSTSEFGAKYLSKIPHKHTRNTNGIPTVQMNWKYLWKLMINKSWMLELKRTHLKKVAMLKATNYYYTGQPFMLFDVSFLNLSQWLLSLHNVRLGYLSMCVCEWFFFLFMFPNTLRQWDKFSRWQNGSAFSDGSIKSINFYWTFVFQVCPVQCSGKSRKRSFTLPLCCTIYNFAKMPAIVNETNALKIRKNKNDAYTFKRWIYWC